MAEKYPSPPRLIPNFNMTAPWSDPQTEAELDGLAMTALLSGATPNNRSIVTLLGQFAGDYARNLNNGRA